jgi:ribonuclease HI
VPWVIAELRGKQVYARANAKGELLTDGGRVEIRYNPKDGRMYRAGTSNLKVVDPTPLPDDTCGSAEAVQRKDAKGAKNAGPAPRTKPTGDEMIVYTDGACSSNPGPAGLGVVIIGHDERIELSEYLGQGTNNIAELTAVLRALEQLDPKRPAVIHTDSSYTIGVAQKGWKAKANQKLVAELRATLKRHPKAVLVYVKGHAGIELNERADELARWAITHRGNQREVIKAG